MRQQMKLEAEIRLRLIKPMRCKGTGNTRN